MFAAPSLTASSRRWLRAAISARRATASPAAAELAPTAQTSSPAAQLAAASHTSPPVARLAATAQTPTAMTIEEARKLRDELARFSQSSEYPDLASDMAARLREQVLGEPLQLEHALHIPPWQVTTQSDDGVELTWTQDLGHESGTRLWLIANVERLPNGWKVRAVTLAHAHARR
jgi:hypothetical protein